MTEQKQMFGNVSTANLSEDQKADIKIVASSIDARMLELQEIRMLAAQPRHLLQQPHLQHLHPDEPQLCACGRAT